MCLLRNVSVGLLFLLPSLSLGQDKVNQTKPESQNRLPGLWRGWYHYPEGGQRPVSFEMVLAQEGSAMAAFIKEPNTFGDRLEPWQHAVAKGRFDAATGTLTFIKTYDGTAGPNHDVEYKGLASPDRTRVEGTWNIGDLQGRFTMESAANTLPGPLAGIWSGTYHYPAGSELKPVPFHMVVVHQGKRLTGFIKEPNTFGKKEEPWLHADFKGRMDDQTGILTFTKTYDGTAGQVHDVEYSGLPSQDRTRVEGNWVVPDIHGGRFTLQKLRLDGRALENLK